MASLNQLLDNFGPPPQDICRDWIEQIQEFYAASELDGAGLRQESKLSVEAGGSTGDHSFQPVHRAAVHRAAVHRAAVHRAADTSDWRDWEISAFGELVLPQGCSRQAAEAVRVLQSWLNRPLGVQQLQATAADALDGDASYPTAISSQSSTTDSRSQVALCQGRAHKLRCTGQRQVQAHKLSRPKLAIGVIALSAGLVGLVVLAGRHRAKLPSVSPDIASSPLRTEDGSTPAANSSTQQAFALDRLEHGQPEEFEELTTSTGLFGALGDWPASSTAENQPQTQLSLGLEPLIPPDMLSTSNDSVLPPTASLTLGHANDETTGDVTRWLSLTSPQGLERVDPTFMDASLAAVMTAAENQPPATAADAIASSSEVMSNVDRLVSPAAESFGSMIIFDRSVLVQRIQWPRALSKRLRESSVWCADLELPEGFVVEPEAGWRIRAGETKTWRVYATTSREPRTGLVIQLTCAPARDGALVCRISGSGDDLPHVQLPLSRKWLDPIAAHLKQGITALSMISERTSAQVPSELRSDFGRQKRQAKESLKHVERILQIAADSDRLASLLDGECSVRVEIREAATDAPWPVSSSAK